MMEKCKRRATLQLKKRKGLTGKDKKGEQVRTSLTNCGIYINIIKNHQISKTSKADGEIK